MTNSGAERESSPPVMAILSSFLCVTVFSSSLIPCSLVRSLILPPPPSPRVPLALYHSLSPSVIPPQSPPPDRGDGRACGRVSCTGAHTARPPAGPQCTANSHKAPTDTQMDKRIWIRIHASRTCKRAWTTAAHARSSLAKHHTPSSTHQGLLPDTRISVQFCPAFVDIAVRNNDIVIHIVVLCP